MIRKPKCPIQTNHKHLGYLEHTKTLSIARYPENIPEADWDKLEKLWKNEADPDERITLQIPDLWAKYYICRNFADLNDADPVKGLVRLGMIVHRSDLLMVNGSGEKIEFTIGDVFITPTHYEHKAKTQGLFVFGVKDLRTCDLPKVEKARKHFLRDVERIRKFATNMA